MRRNQTWIVLWLVAAVLAVASCNPAPTPTIAPLPPTAVAASPTAVAASPTAVAASPTAAAANEWDQTVAAAKQEGKVILSMPNGMEEFQKALTVPFEQKYGIPVEASGLGAKKVLSSLQSERSAGQYRWDVLVGGTDSLFFNLKPLGALDPIEPALILPAVRDPKNWLGNRLPFFDRDHLGLYFLSGAGQYFWINTKMAKPDDIKTYRDLLDPKWKGKILITRDPRESGHGRSVFSYFYGYKDLGPEFVRELVTKQNLQIPRDDDEAAAWLKQANFALCICNNSDADMIASEKLPYQVIDPHQVKEGISVTSSYANVALVNRAPHPNAAKVYANWLLSQETATNLSKISKLASPRVDVTKEFVKPSSVPMADWSVGNSEDSLAQAEETVKFLKGIMGK